MTLTAAQAEIVRRFVAEESVAHIASPIPGGVTDRFTQSEVMHALRAALVEKDAEIERLEERIALMGDGWRSPTA